MKYSLWAELWLSQKTQYVKESTLAVYSNTIVNHLIPKFGGFNLDEINEEIIQQYAFELLENGRLDKNGGLGERSAKDIIVILKNSLRDAMKKKMMNVNTLDIKFPKRKSEQKIKIISPNIQQRLIQSVYLNLNSKSAGLLLCLYTGLRIGEICGLRWEDIDLENRIIKISRTLQRVYKRDLDGSGKSKVIISSPKSRTSQREIPISAVLMPVLRKFVQDESCFYFISGTEKSIEVRTYRSFFEKFLKRNEIDFFNFHALRHTFATRCIEAGGDCKTVSQLLGHSTVNMTLNLYVHPQMEHKRKCIELLSDII